MKLNEMETPKDLCKSRANLNSCTQECVAEETSKQRR